eukprot:jgi/Tetstr1/443761/TSEL_031749.t1
MSLCRELGQAGRLGWCAGCGGMLEGLVASKVSLVAVRAWAVAGGAGSGRDLGGLGGFGSAAARRIDAGADLGLVFLLVYRLLVYRLVFLGLLRSPLFTPRRALAVS